MTIYYYCRDNNTPSGGRKVIYQHVDILNSCGIDAIVVHEHPEFRVDWFENTTRITDLETWEPTWDDIVVVPETMGGDLESLKIADIPKVFFVQGPALMFVWGNDENPYYHPSTLGIMTVSDWATDMLRFAFPTIPIGRVYNSLDKIDWTDQKQKLVAYNPGKGFEYLQIATSIVNTRRQIPDWGAQSIEGQPADVREVLRNAALFAASSMHEGLGMLPLEAGAAGCGVVGFDGGGGRDYWQNFGFMYVPSGNFFELANTIEYAARMNVRTSQENAEKIKRNFSAERQKRSVLAYWHDIIEGFEMRRISVIIPSMGRAAQLRECLQQLIKSLDGIEHEIIVVIDKDMESVLAVQDLPIVLLFREEKAGALTAWNVGLRASQFRRPDDLFVLGADDLVFNPGWAEEVMRMAAYGDYIGLTYYENNDRDKWPTHYAVTRHFMLDHLNGSLAMACYHHNCTDLESWQRAVSAGGYVEGRQIVQHKHPAYGTAVWDETYRNGCGAHQGVDMELYRKRQAEGFPDDWEAAISE